MVQEDQMFAPFERRCEEISVLQETREDELDSYSACCGVRHCETRSFDTTNMACRGERILFWAALWRESELAIVIEQLLKTADLRHQGPSFRVQKAGP